MDNSSEKHIAVGLDIGTTKICAVVGERSDKGKINILAMAKTESFGVMRGEVANIQKTVDGIKEVIERVSDEAKINISEVLAGIAGQHIRSMQHSGSIIRPKADVVINDADVERLVNDMYRLAVEPGEQIIHVFPQYFKLDNYSDKITDPVGYCGAKLQAEFHVVTGKTMAANNIIKCVEMSDLTSQGLVLEPVASAESVLSEEEKEAGVVMIDIGGGTTDIAIFYDGIIRHTAVIPMGGNIITKDIQEGLNLMQKQAELLKVKFGSALPSCVKEDEVIGIPGIKGQPVREISAQNLSHIINARMVEIIEHVKYELIHSGFQRPFAGIVVTGGGAQLTHLKELFAYELGLNTSIGMPGEHLDKTAYEEIKSPMYATAVGLVMKSLSLYEKMDENPNTKEVVVAPVPTTKVQAMKQEAKTGGFLTNFIEGAKKVVLGKEDDLDNDW